MTRDNIIRDDHPIHVLSRVGELFPGSRYKCQAGFNESWVFWGWKGHSQIASKYLGSIVCASSMFRSFDGGPWQLVYGIDQRVHVLHVSVRRWQDPTTVHQ